MRVFIVSDHTEKESSRAAERPTAPASGATSRGPFVCVLGAGEGCGTSTLAVNLAALLAQQHHSCALYDLQPGAGEAMPLDLVPRFGHADLAQENARGAESAMERPALHHANGTATVSPPRGLRAIHLVTPEGVRPAVDVARMIFRSIVADLNDCIHDEQVQALQLADVVVLVIRLDFISLRNAQCVLEQLEAIGLKRGDIQVVVNRFGHPQELDVAIAEELLNVRIAHFIPDDPQTLAHSVHSGLPAVLESPGALVSKRIKQLAARWSAPPAAGTP